MKKKTTTRKTIRQIVREEVAMAIHEVVNELKQPSLSSQQEQPIVEKKNYSKNSVLNDVLNETATDGDWKTLGGGEFTSNRMNELVGGQYGDMMKGKSQQVPSSDPMAQFLNKDYREVLKRTDEKQQQKYGK
jgi:hypothetical protein